MEISMDVNGSDSFPGLQQLRLLTRGNIAIASIRSKMVAPRTKPWWHFQRTSKNGNAVPVTVVIPFKFVLKEK
jgi:hypothetical protein